MSQTEMSAGTELLYSSFGTDPDLGELVDMFVDEMPARVSALTDRLRDNDLEGLRKLAHQLKGAAGSYGFNQITSYAARLEDSVRRSEPEAQVLMAVDELVGLCDRVRAGAP